MTNHLDKKVGNIEKPKLEAKPVTITGIQVQEKTKDDKPMKVPLVNLLVKHPDRDDAIKISKIQSLMKSRVVTRAFWLVYDKEENIQKDSAVADLMNYLKVETLKEAEGKTIDTSFESEDSSILCVKIF